MSSKHTLFYATEKDLKSGLERLENAGDIKYIVTGLFDTPELQVFNSYIDIVDIGLSSDGQIKSLSSYLVVYQDERVTPREVPQKSGGIKYGVDSRAESASVTFTPSGEYEDKCIIYGTLSGLDAANTKSKLLWKLFEQNFFKGFEKIKSFKVSPEACGKLGSGMRLTRNYKADTSMDLVR